MTPSLGAPDLDEVVQAVLADAERSLAIGGHFYPFGVATAADGSALEYFAAADPQTGEEIWSLNALDILHRDARRFDPKVCAFAFAAHVRVDGREMAQIEAENRGGLALLILAPSQRTRPWIVTSEMTTAPARPHVWT